MRWLAVSEPTARRRVRRLERAGLLLSEPMFGHEGLRISDAGLKRLGSTLGTPGHKRDEQHHDVGVGWLWTAACEGAFGTMAAVISEREMLSHDRRLERLPRAERLLADAEPYALGVANFDPGGRQVRHYPDLLLRSRAGHTIAVELELTPKGSARLGRVMGAYASDARIDAVLYLVPDARMAQRIGDAAARAGIDDLVHIRRLPPGGIRGGDPLARVTTRSRGRASARATAPMGRTPRTSRAERSIER